MGERQTIIYARYEDVPLRRKAGFNSVLILVGYFVPLVLGWINFWAGVVSLLLLPLFWFALFNIMTGSIYCNALDEGGKLKTWNKRNKYFAAILMLIQVGVIILLILNMTP